MFKDKINDVSDLEFTKIVTTSKSVNQVAEKLGFKFSPGKGSRNKIKERMNKLNLKLFCAPDSYTNTTRESRYKKTNSVGRVGEKYFEFICAKNDISCLREDTCCELYDYVIDIKRKLLKIQVKTAEFKDTNRISKSFYTSHGNFYNKSSKVAYNSYDFDYYFLFCIEDSSAYLVPSDVLTDKIRLWDETPSNGITKTILYGVDFTFEKVIKEIITNMDK